MGESSEELLENNWVFLGMFRCEQCGRSVTIRKATHNSDDERLFHRHRYCASCGARTKR
jgi:hypothetical protein